MSLKSILNEAKVKAITNSNLVKLLSSENGWRENEEIIASFFAKGDFDKEDGVDYDVMELIYGPEWQYGTDSELNYKKSTWTSIDKKFRAVLKKLDKEFIISKGECYKEIKDAVNPEGNIFDDVIYKILKANKKDIDVSYPSLENYRDVENWLKDFGFSRSILDQLSKDEICLIMEEGIGSIKISEISGKEHISVGSRTSSITSGYSIEIITYSTKKKLVINISKTSVNGI